MPSEEPPEAFASPVLGATVAAAAMVAQQVMGKATRDALFLSHFPVSRLPLVTIASTLVSAAVVVLVTRLIQRRGPARVVPAALVVHAIALMAEWAAASRFEAAVAVVVYVHTASVGPTIVSAFWSVVSETFDPHTAKQVVGRIGAGAALGGVFGGGIALGASRYASVTAMLVALAVLAIVAAIGAHVLGGATPRGAPHEDAAPRASGIAVLRQTPYLRLLALIVFASALTQSLLDYALGAEASAAYGTAERLLFFFAIFQTAVGVVSFLLQLAGNRLALERLGVGGTIALHPGGIVVLGAFALGLPGLLTVALQRGGEGVLRASLFRSAYEVLFTPVPQSLKRPTKTAIDVVFDRLGMMAGGLLTLGLIAWAPRSARPLVIGLSVAFALAQLVIAARLHRGYVATLADRLRAGTLKLDSGDIVDATTRQTLSETIEGLDRRTILAEIEALRAAKGERKEATQQAIAALSPASRSAADDRIRTLTDLRSADLETVRGALRQEPARLAAMTTELLELLARDDVARDATRALGPLVPRIVGAIVDVVVDEDRPPKARRRAARLLATVPTQRAADGLAYGLDAKDLGVRYTCGRVLVTLREQSPTLRFDPAQVHARAARELGHRDEGPPDTRSLHHAFNILSLTYPEEPMQLAYGAITADDPALRGIALEYLDVVLPGDLRAALTLRLDAATTRAARATTTKHPSSLDELLKSKAAISVNLAELRRLHDSDADPAMS
jgi:hypothetical protein